MRLLRLVLVLAVLAYAAWLAWPFVSPFLIGPDASAARSLDPGGGPPVGLFWIGAAVLYVLAAWMLGSGNPRAALAYFLGFLADAALRLAIDRGGADDLAARATQMSPYAEGLSAGGIDPTWVVLGVLLLVGLLVAVASQRRRRRRAPGQLAA